ncbi:tol protein, partial [Boeremia exigua]|uniref:tol protein n=1 Tax=Boeremia exigua TaxID=749465 RepID=UPI001E8DD73E
DILSLREDLVGEHKYACLSHCWGAGGLAYKLLKANKYNFCQGFSRQHLPKTFRDAVEICEFLGIRFLWIDALCIVQDDIKDWNKAAAAMAEIYRHSYITIAASAAQNSHEGCFWIDSKTTFARPLRRTPALTIYDWWWGNPNILHLVLELSPLLRRAWVYQEKRMSRRMVHFTSEQLMWECQHYITWENGVTKEKRQTHGTVQLPDAILPTSRIRAWQETVEEYSGLELTFEDDRLPAIAALAKQEMERRPDDTYLTGMWKDTLIEDLVWYRFDRTLIADSGQRPTQPRPSWSWPSVKGKVIFRTHHPLPSAKIVDLSFTPDGPPQLGGYSEASIILRGPS